MTNDQKIRKEFQALANPAKANLLAGFFKTGKGEYAEGDRFWGVMVPETRQIVRKYIQDMGATSPSPSLPKEGRNKEKTFLSEIKILLEKGWHEERLCALLMLVEKFEEANPRHSMSSGTSNVHAEQKKIFDFYLANTKHINNWDLVDLSAPRIVGGFLDGKSKDILQKLAKSKDASRMR